MDTKVKASIGLAIATTAGLVTGILVERPGSTPQIAPQNPGVETPCVQMIQACKGNPSKACEDMLKVKCFKIPE